MQLSGNICVGELEIRPHEHIVLVRGQAVALSAREYDIVAMLAEHPGWVLSAEQLSHETDEDAYSQESVSVLVSRLRQKLAEAGAPSVVETVRGVGYRLFRGRDQEADPDAMADNRRALRDACWQLQEAVMDAENCGSTEQQLEVTGCLEQARRDVYRALAGDTDL